jgi:hypothetical protein
MLPTFVLLLFVTNVFLWKSVEEVLCEFSVTQILNSLVTNTQESAFNLREMTSKVDIRKDAEKLRYVKQIKHIGHK